MIHLGDLQMIHFGDLQMIQLGDLQMVHLEIPVGSGQDFPSARGRISVSSGQEAV